MSLFHENDYSGGPITRLVFCALAKKTQAKKNSNFGKKLKVLKKLTLGLEKKQRVRKKNSTISKKNSTISKKNSIIYKKTQQFAKKTHDGGILM